MIMSARPKSNLSCKLAFEAMALIHLFFFSWVTALVTGKAMPNIPSNTSSTTPAPADNLTEVDPHINVDIESCDEGTVNVALSEDFYELGKKLGHFIPTFYSFDYGINGTFYTIENEPQQIYIEDFSYSGVAPKVYFYVGLTHNTGINNFYVPGDYNDYKPCNITDGFMVGGPKSEIPQYDEVDMVLTLPKDYTIYNIRWIMVWCRAFGLDMGHVSNKHFKEESTRKKRDTTNLNEMEKKVEMEKMNKMDMISLGKLSSRMYDVQGMVYAINNTTMYLTGFYYNGEAPDAYFYAGSTEKVGENGFKIPDEKGSEDILEAYVNKNITLSLPEGKSVEDIKWFSVFCDSYLEDFGHIRLEGITFEKTNQNVSTVEPMDDNLSNNQTDMSNDSENMEESKIPSDMKLKSDPKSQPESEKEHSDSDSHPHPHPEPGPVDTLPRQEGSTGSSGTGLLTNFRYQLLMITVLFHLLFR